MPINLPADADQIAALYEEGAPERARRERELTVVETVKAPWRQTALSNLLAVAVDGLADRVAAAVKAGQSRVRLVMIESPTDKEVDEEHFDVLLEHHLLQEGVDLSFYTMTRGEANFWLPAREGAEEMSIQVPAWYLEWPMPVGVPSGSVEE